MTNNEKTFVFPSLLNRAETIPSKVGSKEYEWEYLDKKGEKHKDKKNVYEEIQSNKRQTDYKEKILKGELENGSGIYLDTTKLGDGSYNAVSDYLQALAEIVKTDNNKVLFKENTSENIERTEQNRAESESVVKETTNTPSPVAEN